MEVPTEYGYRYRALSAADSVRLLTISRADDQPHGMLLSLKEAHLDDQPNFAALSYTWKLPEYVNRGNLEDQECGVTIEVICDGKAMVISENLFNFLCAALHASETDDGASDTKTKLASKVSGILKDLPLWIDAFCINQSDSEEKRHQVLLMHRIYSAARNVIIWLGPSRPHPDVLWVHDKFIPAISKATRMKPEFVERYLKKDAVCSSVEVMEEFGPELCTRWLSAWLQFVIYIDRQCWFDRGWIVQEVALSDPSNVYVCCGGSVLSWKRLAAFSQFLQETGWCSTLMERIEKIAATGGLQSLEHKKIAYPAQVNTRILKISQARTSLAGVAQQTGLLVDARSAWNGKLELGWLNCANFLINSLRSSKFSDDRDHIYGCLGMLSMLLPQGCESPIVPDYESTVEEVFTAAAGLFLSKTSLLTELSRIGKRSSRRYPKLPSWVPDYSIEKVSRLVANWNFPINRYLDLTIPELQDIERQIWGSDLRRPKLIGSVLYVHGFLLDTVLEESADRPFGWESRGIQALMVKSGPNAEDFTGFWKTLAFIHANTKLENETSFASVMEEISANRWKTLTQGPNQQLKESSASAMLQPQNAVRVELVDREIYSTEGHELGLGPPEVREADEVWLLEGARTPCILRRVEFTFDNKSRKEDDPGRYEFIGETDLRGFNVRSTDLTSKASRGFYEIISLV